MKAWLKITLSVLFFSGFVGLMAYINYHSGPFVSRPAVAGASTTKSATIVASKTPLGSYISNLRGDKQLVEDARLNSLANARLSDMLAQRYYGHISPNGTDFSDYLTDFGLSSSTTSCENLLMSSQTEVSAVVGEWIASPPHKKCMLDPTLNAMGSASGVFDRQTGQMLYVTIYARL